jgi:hypothetical protein
MKMDITLSVYQSPKTVFTLADIAMLSGETDMISLSKKMNYYVKKGTLGNPRKGIYTKPDYKPEEMACAVFKPSYLSLEYVLQKTGIVFQYDSRLTSVSYLSRTVTVDGHEYIYRKIKNTMLLNTSGILTQENGISMASAERAFLDLCYLQKHCYFDNLKPLDNKQIEEMLRAYQSKAMTRRVKELVNNSGH